MSILAIDTSMDMCNLCLKLGGGTDAVFSSKHAMKKGHAEAIVEHLSQLLKKSGQNLQSLTRLVVSTGPGSYTGIKLTFVVAKSIKTIVPCEIVGVSNLYAYAYPHIVEEHDKFILSCINAHDGALYFCLYHKIMGLVVAPQKATLDMALDIVRAVYKKNRYSFVVAGNIAEAVAEAGGKLGLNIAAVNAAPAPKIEHILEAGRQASASSHMPAPFYLNQPAILS